MPWTADDIANARDTLGDSEMSCFYCVLYVKGDWAEYAGIVGFPTWRDGVRPCLRCDCSVWNMQTLIGITPEELGDFRETTAESYDDACTRCERLVVLDRSSHAVLCTLLRIDKRQDGNRGFAVTYRPLLQQLGLAVGDRLEPSEYTLGVCSFWLIALFPHPFLFLEAFRRRLGSSSESYLFQPDSRDFRPQLHG